MRYFTHPEVRARGEKGLERTKQFVDQFGASRLDWVRIDLGRQHRDRLGRMHAAVKAFSANAGIRRATNATESVARCRDLIRARFRRGNRQSAGTRMKIGRKRRVDAGQSLRISGRDGCGSAFMELRLFGT